MSRISHFARVLALAVSIGAMACSSSDSSSGSGGSGGLSSSSGAGSGGTSAASSSSQAGSGGKSSSGGSASAGATSSSSASGGATSTGGGGGKGGTTGATGGATGGKGGGTGSTDARDGGVGSGGTTSTRDGGAETGGRTAGDGGLGGEGGKGGSGAGGQTGGTGGTTSTGGSSGNNPCKASPCTILPVGDSITLGFGSSDQGGYRSELFKLIVAANQNATFVGSQSGGPDTVSGKTFPKNHEGYNSITVSGITDKMPPTKPFSTIPHIILLHIGTNDMTNKADAQATADKLDTLVGNLVKAAPEALVVVAKIIPLGYNDAVYPSYIAKIPDVVKKHSTKGENVVMVDMSTLPTSDIKGSGDVHPTAKGYADMAGLWYGVIKDYLPN